VCPQDEEDARRAVFSSLQTHRRKINARWPGHVQVLKAKCRSVITTKNEVHPSVDDLSPKLAKIQLA
jgi:hypothetical protein